STAATALSSGALARSTRTTRAPSQAKRTAVARPMPPAAPVMTTTFPSKRSLIETDLLARRAPAWSVARSADQAGVRIVLSPSRARPAARPCRRAVAVQTSGRCEDAATQTRMTRADQYPRRPRVWIAVPTREVRDLTQARRVEWVVG